MFHFTENVGLSQTVYFWFEKHLIENMNWAILPKKAKAIYPVIRSYCNKEGEAFPGEETISILSGRTPKVVRSGIKALEGFPGFRFEAYTTRRGRSSKRFTCKVPEYRKGTLFPFHKDILMGGNWSLLKPTAQALYPVMRYFGFNDFYEYCEGDELEEELGDFGWENFKNRQFDFCEAEPSILCDHAGITRRSYSEAVWDLEKHYMIKSDRDSEGRSRFLVYLHPPMIYKRDGLNTHSMTMKKKSEDRQKQQKTKVLAPTARGKDLEHNIHFAKTLKEEGLDRHAIAKVMGKSVSTIDGYLYRDTTSNDDQ